MTMLGQGSVNGYSEAGGEGRIREKGKGLDG
jgi:hypothetical protein